MDWAFWSPKWVARAWAMESVDRRVPYRSNARMVSVVVVGGDMVRGGGDAEGEWMGFKGVRGWRIGELGLEVGEGVCTDEGREV